MFHAAGWTFPYANVFSFATQVSYPHAHKPSMLNVVQITLRTVNFTHIWNHILQSGVTHYCAAPTVQVGLQLLYSFIVY